MAVWVQNLPKKNLGEISVHSLPHLSVSYPLWGNSNEDQIMHSLSHISLKVESPFKSCHGAKYLGQQLPVKDSCSVQSIGQPHHEVGVMGGANSKCNSSESCIDTYGYNYCEDDYCENGIECQMKPVFVLSNPDPMFNPSHITNTHAMSSAQYPYADAYYGGLLTPYGQHVLPQMGAQMVGTTPTRIPLPFDLAEDGPIYVNPKQYHGILRRRQFRAKLEAQNKLVKTRKPYLHESRHRHALNRVRGSGGRFLSTKNLQQPEQKNGTSQFESQCLETVEYVGLRTTCPDMTSASNGDVNFRQPEHRSSGISPHAGANMQSNGNVMSNGTKHNVR